MTKVNFRWSINTELIAAVIQANDFQLGAPDAPPKLSADRDVAVAIHESFVGNLAEAAIAGDTLTDEQLANLVEKLTGRVPDELKITQEKDPWSITFPASRLC